MKYMILLYGSQEDYDLMAGKPTSKGTLSPADFARISASYDEAEEAGPLTSGAV